MKRILPLIIAVFFSAGCSTNNPTAIDSENHEIKTATSNSGLVPFKASWSTTSVFTGPTSIIIFGQGHATHMGLSTFEGPSQLYPETGQQTGTSTMVAADGDQVSIAYGGVTFPLYGGSAVGFNGDYTVTGGTGKFLGATGGGTYEGSYSFIAQAGQLDLSGTISQPVDLGEDDVD